MKKEELDKAIELIKTSLKEERKRYPCLCENLKDSFEGGLCLQHEIFYAGKEAKKLIEKIVAETRVGDKFKGEIATYEGVKVVISK